MRPNRTRNVSVRLAVVVVFVCVAALVLLMRSPVGERVEASAQGPSPSNTGAPGEANCTACHTQFPVNSGPGSVVISGVPHGYRAGQQIPVTVTVSQEDAVIYGFQLTAIDRNGREVGTFSLPTQNPAQMQIVTGLVGGNTRRYVEHTVDGILPTQFGSKSWTFNWTAPAVRAGKVSFYVAGNASNSDGTTGGDQIYTRSAAALTGTAVSSFDGDGTSETAVWRPSSGYWFSINSSDGGFQATQFGQAGDIIVPGDYDGDGITDRAIYRPSAGAWFVLRSTLGLTAIGFGAPGDIPVQADYDGDLKTDFAVYRPSTGTWFIFGSTIGFNVFNFGTATDKPAPADFDGDGKADFVVYRPSTGIWYMQRSTEGFGAFQFGVAEDRPLPADYDGDGKADLAVYRPSSGIWFLQRSTLGFYAAQFGLPTDVACPADVDGDGRIDIAVFRPGNGLWFGLRSSDSQLFFAGFGITGDVPVPSGYFPQ